MTISLEVMGLFISHDNDLISCADRIIKLEENKPISESSGTSSGAIVSMVESEAHLQGKYLPNH